ncbi:hypothetical protein [Gemmatimonas sp.]|uniref:hypothetical protein n=1 Tax=Gemmatimonas sp. TaxID=1962908 RepID=UPI00398347B6
MGSAGVSQALDLMCTRFTRLRFGSRDGFAHTLRLSFARYDPTALVNDVGRLARAVASYGTITEWIRRMRRTKLLSAD